MKKMVLVLALALTFTGLLGGCGTKTETPDLGEQKSNESTEIKTQESEKSQTEKIKISVAHVLADTHPLHIALSVMKDEIDKQSPDKFKIEVVAGGKLGAEKDLVKKLQEGTIEMAAVTTGTLSAVDAQFAVFDLPFLIKDAQSADKILDGEIGTGMLNVFEKYGLSGLAWMENGFRQLSANKEIRVPMDIRDVKIRTMQNDVHMKYFSNLGAKPSPLEFTQLYQALKHGEFQAQDNPLANTALSKLYEVQKYVMQTDYVYSPIVVLVSKVFWSKLSDADKKIIKDNAFEARLKQRELNRNDQVKYIETITKGGAKYVKLTDEEKAKWKSEAVIIYPEFENKIGKELIEKVKKAGGI
jgi:tripartite ATP-independent transporter DctP family solute receptor